MPEPAALLGRHARILSVDTRRSIWPFGAESVAPFWKAPGPELLEPALHTAAGLEDPGIALMLLRPFAVEWVTPAHAGGLAALAARYGESWHRNLLDAWFGSRNTWRDTGDADRKGWAGAVPGLTAALRDAGAAAAAGWLLAASWGWLDDDIGLWLRYPSPATRRKQLAELGKPPAGLLAAADGTALAGEIVTVLREHGDDVLPCLLPMLRAAGPGPSANLEELARACERRLTAITERQPRANDDWSVPGPAAANCAAHSASSSPTAASARWNGRSPRPAASTSRTRSAPPSCQSSMRSGSSAARTRWC